jgi:hypothetical protein
MSKRIKDWNKTIAQKFRISRRLQTAIRTKPSPEYFDRNVQRFARAVMGNNPFRKTEPQELQTSRTEGI